MRPLLVVCVLVSTAAAAPTSTHTASTDPLLAEAEHRWQLAEHARDPALWDDAASAFITVVDAGKLPPLERAAAAATAVLAVKNALSVDPHATDDTGATTPQPIPAREQRMLHVLETAQRLDADDTVGLAFLRATILRRFAHDAEAIPLFLDILDHHRDHATSEYAANYVLDIYNRQGEYAKLIELAERLRGDTQYLATRPDLATLVGRIHVQGQRLRAEELEKAGEYDRAAEQYLAAADGDESLYNAAVCFERAGASDRARETLHTLIARYPKSRLAIKALARLVVDERDVAHFADAASAAESYATKYAGEHDARDALADAVAWRIALGDRPAATRDLDDFVKLFARKSPAIAEALAIQLVESLIAAGERADASRRAELLLSAADAQAARVLVDASCPVAPIDGLCPKSRNAKLLAAARHLLATPAAVRLDLELEDVLAHRAPAGPVTERYRALAAPTQPVDIQIFAHARLGRLAALAGNRADAAIQLHACLDLAARALTGGEWIATCERDLGIIGVPERVPPPAMVHLETAVSTLHPRQQ